MSAPGRSRNIAKATALPSTKISNSSFKILSYNVNFGLFMDNVETSSNKSVVQAILDSNADIVCLQETNENSEEIIRKYTTQQYPHQLWHHPTNYYAGGSAFLAKPHVQLKRLHCVKPKVKGAFFYNMIVRATFVSSTAVAVGGEEVTATSAAAATVKAPNMEQRNTEVTIEEEQQQQHNLLLGTNSSTASSSSSSPAAAVATVADRSVDIINVHLRPPLSDTGGVFDHVQAYFSTTDAVRLAEVQELVSLLPKDQTPKIILGDFNEGSMGSSFKWLYSTSPSSSTTPPTTISSTSSSAPPSAAATAATSTPPSPSTLSFPHHGKQFKDALYEFHGNASTWYWPVWKFYVFGSYDHIFFESSKLKAKECEIMKKYAASDHLPVLANLEWTL